MKKNKILKILFISLVVVLIMVVISIFTYIYITIKPLTTQDFSLNNNEIKTVFYDYDNNEIESNYIKYTKLEEISENTINAFLSIEDKDFFKHNGINAKRIIGATLNNIKNRKIKEGASTITQQLVKNKFLSNEKTLSRKIKEAYISHKIENKYSKEEILENYLNSIYFGNGAYGIKNAAKKFFNKEPIELSLSESCIIAGSINSPYNYSPINNIDKSIVRRNLILKEMLNDNKITYEEYDEAINDSVELDIQNINGDDLYLEYTLDEASKILNKEKNEIISQGYKIYTYQNNLKQNILDANMNNEKYYQVNSNGNIADSLSILINNENYGVSAIAGKSKYNLLNFKRQPGSLIKPIFTYAPGFEEGIISPITQVNDEKIDINGYSPNNVGNANYGYISVRNAVAKSLNIPTIKITEKLGLEKCKKFAMKCGINFTQEDVGYSLALGGMTEGVTLKEITDAYSVFTSNGNYVKSSFVDKIIDSNGVVVYSRNVTTNKVYSADTAYLMTNTLCYASKYGTSNKLQNLPFDVAGKTGTVNIKGSNLNSDAYSLAYTTNDTMCVWMGNYSMDDKCYLQGNNNGGTYATEIIRDTFSEMYSNNKPKNFEMPDSIVECKIDNKKLQEDHVVTLANNTPERYVISEIFSEKYVPTIYSDKFDEVSKFDFYINHVDGNVEISFETFDYNKYDIYRNDELINTITNYKGNYIYHDANLNNKTKYNYHIVATNKYSNNTYTTNKKSIYFELDYNYLLDDYDNLDFIFN